ncbi:SIR2 family protein [Methylopila henanensis]|uniref:SIR2 family protein n=1 Tax=Methylopila henanensis TaxID=873516 RepID=A0ABW4K6D6_9HYPH
MEIDDAVRCALDGNAVLFVGAGVSFLSKNKSGSVIPDGRSLVDLLLEQSEGTGSPHPLERVAGHVVRKKGVDFVVDLLKKHLNCGVVDERLSRLYLLPWRRIYTTNYDNVIEEALKGHRPVSSITLDNEIGNAGPGSVVHLNGYVGDVSPATLQQRLVLTDYAYGTSRLRDSEWFKFFLRDLRAARAIIFVGYSLADLDIQRALIVDDSLTRKTFFFISPDADELETSALSDYGTLCPGGFDELSQTVDLVSSDYQSVRFSTAFLCLSEITVDAAQPIGSTNVEKLTSQLVYGRLPEHEILLKTPVFGSQRFTVVRKQDANAMEAVRVGPWRDVLYTGELASGKTVSVLNLTSHFIDNGYRVFYATKGRTLNDELRKISRIADKIVVIFENYYSLREEVREYVASRPMNHRVILTERSVTHDLISDFVDQTPHLGPTFEVTLDRIEASDVPAFEALVNFGGFWGDRSGAGESARRAFISTKLESSLYKLLIEIIKSEKVQNEIRLLLNPLRKDKRVLKLFVSSFIVNVLGFRFSLNDWQTVFDGQWVRQTMRAYHEQVQHFLSMQGDTIFPRAGLLSAHILSTVSDDSLVKESLVDLYERASRAGDADPEFVSLRIALTRYGSIEPVFSGTKKADSILQYYEDIRVFGNTRNNSDYWLQVGIAATIHDRLGIAETAFSNAYAREKAKTRPNLVKIDNYFSRFQMRKAIETNDHKEAFTTFVQANERLKKQIFLEENRHYPFKTGRYYTDIAAKHYRCWNENQQRQFVQEAEEIRERALYWRQTHKEFSTDVEILIRETSTLLEKVDENLL